ncbi:acyl-CoA N-acyltransferase [Talaromyces proteolyticus]|uniref:N-alpha-acetyltransferase 40 n=1 Tax=Talaromyces proteolyticus TaxID=1131652 RepID=A0AAD4Q4I9_9EURO|nr:acyl-CoA N-acyltransferase [Talaromyces proteolyticus]KAH8703296.1 acyl-CoA N-acyltransferase [Talaromyces proteolyticus]
MSSTKDSRVKRPASRSPSRSGSGLRLSKHHRERVAKEAAQKQANDLHLVERTNALSLQDFIANFIDPVALQIRTTTALAKDSTTEYQAQIHTANTIPEPDFEGCFALIEQTSSADYSASSIGWSPSKKRKEMRLPDMRYMVLRSTEDWGEASAGHSQTETREEGVRQRTPPVAGFLSFMTTYEDGKEVLYCYEVHVNPALQGQGLGAQVMRLFEEIGSRIGLEKTMLTVFTANAAAVRFYERLGYAVDEYSPGPRKLRNGTVKEPDYLILSKALR